jgi:hypothetical protein
MTEDSRGDRHSQEYACSVLYRSVSRSRHVGPLPPTDRPAPHGMRLFGSALYILRWLELASYNVRQPLSPDNRSFEAFAETPRILDRCCQSTLFREGKVVPSAFPSDFHCNATISCCNANVWTGRYAAFLKSASGSVYELESGSKIFAIQHGGSTAWIETTPQPRA